MRALSITSSKLLIYAVLLLSLINCGGSGGDDSEPLSISEQNTSSNDIPEESCSRSQIENTLQSTLSTINTDVDFSFYIEDESGENFLFNRGSSTLDTPYKSASTSKWVAAAVILQLVDDGTLSLTNRPQDYLSGTEWTIDSEDPLHSITLAQLLSFTSGLNSEPLCLNFGISNFFNCVSTISDNNADNGNTTGSEFYYGSSHLQVAGAMAIKAGSFDSWSSLFSSFKSDTGLFMNSSFNLPSANNPRLAGGMTWTARDYIDFIRAFKNADFYSSSSMVETAISDQVETATVVSSPAFDGLGQDWHYGFGLWIECQNPVFNCNKVTQVSSAGAYGAYPFWNTDKNYFGIVAKEGALGTFTTGFDLFNTVRDDVESWVKCPT